MRIQLRDRRSEIVKAIRLFLFVCLFPFMGTIATSKLNAQDPSQLQFGYKPTASFQSYKIDSVNMDNGNIVINIPIISYPQRGKRLSLSFSLLVNTGTYQPVYSCNNDESVCDWYLLKENGAPVVQNDQIVQLSGFYDKSATCHISGENGDGGGGMSICEEWGTNKLFVKDSSGAQHRLFMDASHHDRFRTVDGSNWLYLPGYLDSDLNVPRPQGTTPRLIDSSGSTWSFSNPNSPSVTAVTDPDGNSISYGASIIDSVGREITPSYTSDLTRCPNIGLPDQPLVSADEWSIPGPNGKATKFKFCYASVHVTSNAFGGTHTILDGFGHTTNFRELSGTGTFMQSIVLPDGTYWSFKYSSVENQGAGSLGEGSILSIHLPAGGSIDYSYTVRDACVIGGNVGSVSSPTIATRTVRDINGHTYLWKYSIGRPTSNQIYTNPNYQGSTVTDPDGNDTVYFYENYFNDDPCTNHERYRYKYQGTGSTRVMLQSIATTYLKTPAPTTYPGLSSWTGYGDMLPSAVASTVANGTTTTATTSYENQNFIAEQRACFTSADTYCQQPQNRVSSTSTLHLGFPTSQSSSGTDGATSYRGIHYRWQDATDADAYISRNLLNAPDEISLAESASSNAITKTATSYDEPDYLTNKTVVAAHPTSITVGLGVVKATNHLHWNEHGLVDFTINPRLIQDQTISYSSAYGGAFPTRLVNALNQPTDYTYDFATASVASVKDANQNTTSYEYFDSGRVRKISYPDGGTREYSYSFESVTPTAGNLGTTSEVVNIGNGASIIKGATLDGIGRVVSKRIGETNEDTEFDNVDRVISLSNPYKPSDPKKYVQFSYDALGRKVAKVNQDGITTASWIYAGNNITYTDESARKLERSVDSLGRLVSVTEDPNNLQYATQYSYDVQGNLYLVNQHGSVRKFQYDALSRMSLSHTPEAGVICNGHGDGTEIGCQADGYDANGNLLYKTDARGVTVNYAYDALNRLVSKTYTNDPANTPSICYQYDSTAIGYPNGNFVGRLTHEWTQSGACSATLPSSGVKTRRSIRKYDAMGRVKVEERCVLANCTTTTTPFTLHFDYDLAGNLTEYDNGIRNLTLMQTYDSAGRLNKVTSSAYDATHPNTLYSVGSFFPNGVPYIYDLGLHLNTTQGLDNRLRPTTLNVVVK